MNEPMRPLTLGEILDRTAQLYRRNFWLFAGVSAVPMGGMIAVFVVFGGLFGAFAVMAKQGQQPNPLLVGVLAIAMVLIALPLLLAATVYSNGALTFTAARVHLGDKPKIKQALKSVTARFGRYLWLIFLQGIFVAGIPSAIAGTLVLVLYFLTQNAPSDGEGAFLLGFVLILIAIATAVVIVLRALEYAMSFAVCVVEGKSAWPSLRRAAALSQGTRGRIFVMFLLIMMLSFVLSMAVYIPILIVIFVMAALTHGGPSSVATIVVAEILNVLMNFIVQTLLTPVYSIALVLFYYDQRVRKEGYDIEWMMQQAGLAAPVAPSTEEPPMAEASLPAPTEPAPDGGVEQP
jgi:hypothetical protein